MTVAELITKLKDMPQDAECYYSSFDGFLDEDMKRTQPARITDRESAEIYPIDCEHGTKYTWATRRGVYVKYTGVFFDSG